MRWPGGRQVWPCLRWAAPSCAWWTDRGRCLRSVGIAGVRGPRGQCPRRRGQAGPELLGSESRHCGRDLVCHLGFSLGDASWERVNSWSRWDGPPSGRRSPRNPRPPATATKGLSSRGRQVRGRTVPARVLGIETGCRAEDPSLRPLLVQEHPWGARTVPRPRLTRSPEGG